VEGIPREKHQDYLELARTKLNQQLYQQQLLKLQQISLELQKAQGQDTRQCTHVGGSVSQQPSQHLTLQHKVEICREGGCRVMAYDRFLSLLVSQRSTSTLFSSYEIKNIDAVEFRPTQFVFSHPRAIGDLAFHPLHNDLLLSVKLDRCAKLFNVSSNTVVQSYATDNQLCSCCWNANNSNLCFVGTNNGAVLNYDAQMGLYAGRPHQTIRPQLHH
jgi:WD40 repeat protein